MGHASCGSLGSQGVSTGYLLPLPGGGGGEGKGCFCVFLLWPGSVGAKQDGSTEPSSSTSWQACQILLYPHGTSSSHLKWEERGGGSADFPPGLNLSQLHADRLRKPREDKQRRLVRIFQNSPKLSPLIFFLPYLEKSWPGFYRSKVHLRGRSQLKAVYLFQTALDPPKMRFS